MLINGISSFSELRPTCGSIDTKNVDSDNSNDQVDEANVETQMLFGCVTNESRSSTFVSETQPFDAESNELFNQTVDILQSDDITTEMDVASVERSESVEGGDTETLQKPALHDSDTSVPRSRHDVPETQPFKSIIPYLDDVTISILETESIGSDESVSSEGDILHEM